MYNKLSLFIIVFCSLVIIACNQTKITKRVVANISDDSITISNGYSQSYNLQATIGDSIFITKKIESNKKVSFVDVLKEKKEAYYDIALLLEQGNGDIKMKLKIDDVLDTIIIYHLDIEDTSLYSTKVLTGNCAHLLGNFDAANVEGDIIKWLFRKKIKNVGDEAINNMRLYLQELNRTSYKEYVTSDKIPVMTSFKGIDYSISSDLNADNYYLFACKNEKEIEDFVEEMVSIKFDGASHSLNQSLPCYRGASSSGIICIYLIGIDDDWNYRIAPIGLVCIDNKKPYTSIKTVGALSTINETKTTENNDIILNKNKIRIKMPSNVPAINGYASLETRDWGGNGISANVNFSVSFAGDIKSLAIERSGNLAKWVGKDTFVLDLQGKTSPYIFTYELHLEDGDNYVPVTITDLRGNKTEYKFNVACTMTRNNNPEINIDNNVNVW